jgi:hypothetical protein
MHHTLYTIWHTPYIIYHTTHIIIIRHTSIRHTLYIVHHMPYAIRHMYGICHTSYVIHNTLSQCRTLCLCVQLFGCVQYVCGAVCVCGSVQRVCMCSVCVCAACVYVQCAYVQCVCVQCLCAVCVRGYEGGCDRGSVWAYTLTTSCPLTVSLAHPLSLIPSHPPTPPTFCLSSAPSSDPRRQRSQHQYPVRSVSCLACNHKQF